MRSHAENASTHMYEPLEWSLKGAPLAAINHHARIVKASPCRDMHAQAAPHVRPTDSCHLLSCGCPHRAGERWVGRNCVCASPRKGFAHSTAALGSAFCGQSSSWAPLVRHAHMDVRRVRCTCVHGARHNMQAWFSIQAREACPTGGLVCMACNKGAGQQGKGRTHRAASMQHGFRQKHACTHTRRGNLR